MIAVVSVSCNDWLNVTSSSELQADKLYETRTGFHEALTGVYMTMTNSTYGQAYNWTVNNYSAYPYKINSQLEISEIQKHKYTNTRIKSIHSTMWSDGYNIIANINIILRELENRRHVVTSDIEYKLIKGELLALRALVHFDLMRMFGVNDWSAANASKLTVPYITVYSAEVTPQRSYAETETLLLADLNTALECLKEVDPIIVEPSDAFESTLNADGYWTKRNKHMNYYAVAALAARVYQWKNELDTAAEYAQDVIDGVFDAGLVSWIDADAMLKETSDDYRDWNFTTEHVFSLDVTGLYSVVQPILFSNQSSSLYIEDSFVNLLFPATDPQTGSLAGLEDLRGSAMQMKYTNLGYVHYKYYGSSNFHSDYRNRIAMTRISEMYYIVADYLISIGDNENALKQMDIVRSHRGITSEYPAEVDAAVELTKEYYREFIGEDKLFYFLKYKNVEKSLSETFDLKASDLIYPYPDEEINYGRKQEL